MRRYLVLLMAMLFVGTSLISCQSNSSKTEENETTTETEFVFPAEIPMIPDDPEGNLYFTCKNWDSDLYMKAGKYWQDFYILSKVPLNTEEIKVTVPIETGYLVEVNDWNYKEFRMTDYMLNKDQPLGHKVLDDRIFPYYLYQCYRGTDWKYMKELYDEAMEAEDVLMETIGGGKTEKREEAEATIQRYYDYRDQYLNDYNALTSEDLPMFYIYKITINFGIAEKWLESIEGSVVSYIKTTPAETIVSETFYTLDIKVGENTYTQTIGEMRLHAEESPETWFADHHENRRDNGFGNLNSVYPWGDGIGCHIVCDMIALKDLTITELFLYESDMTILGAHVVKQEAEGSDKKIDFYWDTKSPIEVEEGNRVTIDLFFQDKKMAQLEYAAILTPVVKYTIDSDSFEMRTYDVELDRGGASKFMWLRYAVVFDGLEEELKSYFEDYYRPLNETWREEMPW